MRIGITLLEKGSLESVVSQHFGQSKYFLLVDIDDSKITGTDIVVNNAQHGGGGCLAVDEMLQHNVNHVISGGMGAGAQQKFAAAGVQVHGHSGKAKDAVDGFLNKSLDELGACAEHGDCH